MNTQIDFLKKRLESIAGNPMTSDSRVAQQLLEEFPEEDTENVKAFRAVETLLDYLETNDVGPVGYDLDPPLDEQLRRVGSKIRKEAREDVVDRLEVDKTEVPFEQNRSFEETVIEDPVSKVQYHVSGFENPHGMKEYYAREILEAPL